MILQISDCRLRIGRLRIGDCEDCGLQISDFGFRISDCPAAIRNPQSPIPNPQLAIRNLQFAIRNRKPYHLQWFVSLRAARSGELRSIALWQSGLVIALMCMAVPLAAQPPAQAPAPTAPPSEQTQRLEGEAVIAFADAALAGKPGPADFQISWENEFLKAQRGTFVPFTLTIDASRFSKPAVLVHVRAVRREPTAAPFRSDRPRSTRIRRDTPAEEDFAVDAIFPAQLALEPGQMARIRRGMTLAPASYDVFVVVRERVSANTAPPKAAVLKQAISVPDFSTGGLSTSTVIVAERLDVLREPVPPEELAERPYVIGQNDITPAKDRKFRKNEELIVVFLVYNPFVTPEKHFDLKVEYHFFRRGGPEAGADRATAGEASPPTARDGERYFNHTEPQRFNPGVLGGQFDPTAGNPVMAGQGVPLSGFEQGDYRLAIRVTDLLAGTSIVRDVHFSVGS
jgi:hypothetical protein